MRRWLIPGCTAAALAAAASATSQVVVGLTAYRSVVVPASATRALSVSCPAGYFAVSAGVTRADEGVKQLAARPLSRRAFAFRLANADDLGHRVTVGAACRRVRARGGTAPHLTLSARRRVRVQVAPSGLRQARLTCPKGTIPAAVGFDLGRNLSLRQVTQDLHVLTFGVFNGGSTPRTALLYAGCLTIVHSAGSRATKLQISLVTDTVPIHAGSQIVTRICPRGWLSFGVGYSLPAGVELNGAAAVARTGRWSLRNSAQKPVLAHLQLACARLT
jgi:hypothetical protein